MKSPVQHGQQLLSDRIRHFPSLCDVYYSPSRSTIERKEAWGKRILESWLKIMDLDIMEHDEPFR